MGLRLNRRERLLLTGIVLILAIAAQSQESPKAFYQSPGTKKMAALLEKILLEQPWQTDPNKSAERVQRLQADLAAKPSLRDELKMREALAENLLRAGDSAGAVEQLEKIRNLASENGIVLAPFFEKQIRDTLAIAYLRLGEQENCVQYHGQESCVFPIHGSGVHKLQRGAQGAVRELTAALEKDSSNLKSRWLLNIAYMTLGRYPADVPAQWLIPSSRFDSEYDHGKFLDIAPSVGLAVTGHSGGAILENFDGDGLLDLMVSSSGPRDQLRFFHNNEDGTFPDRTAEAGLTGETGGLNCIAADFDNDSHPDLLILRGGWWGQNGKYPMSLLRNNGNGTFDDVTERAGLLSLHPTQTAASADFDNDG